MIILPAIDMKDGRCVRLQKGEFSTVSQVADSALETARAFAEAGAKWVHMVDLDGARGGRRTNFPHINAVIEGTGLSVELGGGIVVWDGGAPIAEVPLAIAGIMSDEPLEMVNEKLETAKKRAHGLGVGTGIDPFMTLSFMALPVIPSLRITTRGVFDVNSQSYV